MKPNWLRWLGRDFPPAYELAVRAQEKSRIVAGQLRPGRAADRPTGALDAAALGAELTALGVRPGDALMMHSSWDRARVLAPSPVALVSTVRELLGPDGTLCMPTYPELSATDPSAVFDLRKSPSRAGLITEIFRRTPGVSRSAHLRSVAAAGPLGAELLREHHLSPYPSGTLSPYAKLAEVGGKVLCVGVGAEYNSMFHCAEDILEEDFPAPVYENGLFVTRIRREDGTVIEVPAYERGTRWHYCADAARMLPYLEDVLARRFIGDVELSVVAADKFLERLLMLARLGIHMYGFRFPSPAKVLNR